MTRFCLWCHQQTVALESQRPLIAPLRAQGLKWQAHPRVLQLVQLLGRVSWTCWKQGTQTKTIPTKIKKMRTLRTTIAWFTVNKVFVYHNHPLLPARARLATRLQVPSDHNLRNPTLNPPTHQPPPHAPRSPSLLPRLMPHNCQKSSTWPIPRPERASRVGRQKATWQALCPSQTETTISRSHRAD
jgi:hypothetical protein